MAECHPVGFQWVMEAQGARREDHPRRPPLHAHQRGGRPARAAARRHRHRVPGRDRQPHPVTTSADFRRVRARVHERRRDRRRALRRHRGPRRAVLRLGRRRARYDPQSWQYEGMEAFASGRQARGGRDPRRAAPTTPRAGSWRGATARRPTRRSSIRAASSRSSSATSRATRRRWWSDICGVPQEHVPARWPRRCARTPAASAPRPSATPSAGRSTRSASSTSAPRRSSSCCWATSAARAAGSSPCAGTPRSRARPTSRRSTTSCPATSRCPTPHRHQTLSRLRGGQRRRPAATGATWTPTSSAC